MKNLLFVILLSFSSLAYGQKEKRTINIKSIKIGVVCAGSMLVAGSVVNIIRIYQPKPDNNFERYNGKQRDLSLISTRCYALSGASLIMICFNF